MTACAERHPAGAGDGLAGEGQLGTADGAAMGWAHVGPIGLLVHLLVRLRWPVPVTPET
jgi:hypothetical protein